MKAVDITYCLLYGEWRNKAMPRRRTEINRYWGVVTTYLVGIRVRSSWLGTALKSARGASTGEDYISAWNLWL